MCVSAQCGSSPLAVDIQMTGTERGQSLTDAGISPTLALDFLLVFFRPVFLLFLFHDRA